MKTILRAVAFVLACMLAVPAVAASAQSLLAEANEVFAERMQKGKAAEAIGLYQKVLAEDPSMVEPYWRIGWAHVWVALQTDDQAKKAELLEEAIEYCKLAVDLDPKAAPAHFWLAMAYGRYGEMKGVAQGLYLLPYFKGELEKVVELDTSLFWAGGYRMLGILYHEAPGIAGGDEDKAMDFLEKAVEKAPDFLENRIWLAKVYLCMGKKDLAKAQLEAAKKLQPPWPALFPHEKGTRTLTEDLAFLLEQVQDP